MDRLLGVLRAIILPLGWICALLAVTVPLWFLVAALGTKWEFWTVAFGLDWMTHSAGYKLLLACLVAGLLGAVLMLVYRILGREAVGVVTSPVLALVVAATGLSWDWHVDRARATTPLLLDITTDPDDPPHFTPSFQARRSRADATLDYAAKRAPDGRPLAEAQAAAYPGLVTARVPLAPDTVFRRALDYAHEERWRVGTASESAAMFEAGAESVWFGLRDDIVVRVREDGEGGSLVDIRSLARNPGIHDLGRNARRVRDFLGAMSPA
jgi:lipid-A-disaccharide synthase-like uncharacterized protein